MNALKTLTLLLALIAAMNAPIGAQKISTATMTISATVVESAGIHEITNQVQDDRTPSDAIVFGLSATLADIMVLVGNQEGEHQMTHLTTDISNLYNQDSGNTAYSFSGTEHTLPFTRTTPSRTPVYFKVQGIHSTGLNTPDGFIQERTITAVYN